MKMMNLNKFSLIVASILVLAMVAGCEKTIVPGDDSPEEEDPADYSFDTSIVVQITLNGTSISVVPSVADVSGSKVTIKSAGTYNITGSLTDGQIIVETEDEENVNLIFDGIDIKSSSSAPVFVKNAKKVVICLKEDTKNYLSDGASYSTTDEPNAALFSNAFLTFFGGGSLNVTGNYNDGISTDDGMIIKSGTISVTSADDGIRGKDYLVIRHGNIIINAKGDGLTSDNEGDASLGYITIDSAIVNITSSGDGISAQSNLIIGDGSFTITTGGGAATTLTTTPTGGGPGGGGRTSGGYSGTISAKALKSLASLVIEKGKFTINSADDAIHSNNSVKINNGTFSIASGDDAIHADVSIEINDGTINITKCYEGIESASIIFNGGNMSLVSTDDGFNATKGSATEINDGSSLNINDGTIVVNSSKGDGLDSNGNVNLTGGTVVVHGPQSAPEVGFDINGTFNVSGGFLIAAGPNSGNMIEVPASSSAQYCVKATMSSTLSSSTLFNIQDASGNNLVTYKPVRSVYYVVFSSSDLKNGSTYSIYTGGTSTGTNTNGIYYNDTYSGGTLKKTFTVSNKITSVSF